MNRFNQLFDKNKKAFIPFFMLGYPSLDESLTTIKAAIDAGVHALELGIPFSDPVADGPVIQRAAEQALAAGVNFADCCQLLKEIRAYSDIPVGLLTYYNVIYQHGEQAYADLQAAGVDAILVVDLPLEESSEHEALLKQHQLGCVHLIAPNTPDGRAKQLLNHCTAYAYVVSRYGVTGSGADLSEQLPARVQALKQLSDCPLAVGFGISTPEHVTAVHAAGAEAAIIGSKLTAMSEVQSICQFIQSCIN